MRRVMRPSGDLIADRRYQYGVELSSGGDHAAAADLFKQALERAPHWADAWFALARERAATHDPAGAAAAFREALRLDPEDPLGASLELSRLDASVEIDAAPLAYVEGLFNAYAEDFDKALVERLGYATPQQLARVVRAMSGVGERHFQRVLDLGCGTGLSGEAFVAAAGWLEGVDLSEAMLGEARAKGVYSELAHADIVSFLSATPHDYDLIVAADVFIYFGDLKRLFAAAAARLVPGGLFAFSVERGAGADVTLRDSLRFAHSADYVRNALSGAGLELANIEQAVLRKDRGADIDGLLAVARKPLEAAQSHPHETAALQTPFIAKPN